MLKLKIRANFYVCTYRKTLIIEKLQFQFLQENEVCSNDENVNELKDAVEKTLEQIDVIHKLVDDYSDDLVLATSSFQVN